MYKYRKGALMYNTTGRRWTGEEMGGKGGRQVEADRQLELCSWVE